MRVVMAMTISSSAAFPARSPMPFTVHSTCRAPFSIAAREFATASPRSLWQCALRTARSMFLTRSRTCREHRAVLRGDRVADRVGEIDDRGARRDRGLDDLAEEADVATRRVLARELDVRTERAGVPARRPRRPSSTWSRVLLSLCVRWISDVAMNVWMRGRSASLKRLPCPVDVGLHRAAEPATVHP